mmetsp:Transcript_114601/g.335124  ORF Transcript_114601/g.335124 Transcript_114601/m.335124 type:complete len:896 (-) Transcript_114601:378-3065(-)
MEPPELTPEPAQGEKQEPETEDDVSGWELIEQPAVRSAPRTREPSMGDEWAQAPEEVPDDLVMGCLDPECDAQFGGNCRRRTCTLCRLPFCKLHLTHWMLFGPSPSGSREPSPRSARSPSAGSKGSGRQASSSFAECFGLRAGPGPAQLCRGCLAALAPPGRSAQAAAPAAGTDVAALVAEGDVLRAMSLASLRTAAEGEAPCRAVARGLLLGLLGSLRTCLRPWTEPEQEWVWRLREELAAEDPAWIPQFVRQATWAAPGRAAELAELLEQAHATRRLGARGALQVLAAVGRRAAAAAAALGSRRLGTLVSQAAQCLAALDLAELVCCLELLLAAGSELGAVGATDGRQAIVGVLLQTACEGSAPAAALRGELFWALEARARAFAAARRMAPAATSAYSGGCPQPAEQWAWAGVALEELLRSLPPEAELSLLRQRAWVRQREGGEAEAVRVDSAWGAPRAFPLAVWPTSRLCLGLEGQPQQAVSRSTPVILRCRCREKGAAAMQRVGTAGLLLKRDVGMHREQQVGQTLRLLERLIWEDAALCRLLADEGLSLEDVRVTYVIAMTGPETAMLEAVETARTLRSVRASFHAAAPGAAADGAALLDFLRQHNCSKNLPKALVRLAFTAALSAVLSFAVGLGDRHHENFMVTIDGRLLHVDYGYAFGQEPLDSVLIHYAVQGGPPATTLQYHELRSALGPELLQRVFWPVARGAYLRVRRHAPLLAEMVHSALVRTPRRSLAGSAAEGQQTWAAARAFAARRCAPSLGEGSAGRFVCQLLRYCAQHEQGARLRDELKVLRLRERTQQAVAKACGAALSRGRHASAALGHVSQEATVAARGAAFGLFDGVRELLLEASSDREPPAGSAPPAAPAGGVKGRPGPNLEDARRLAQRFSQV